MEAVGIRQAAQSDIADCVDLWQNEKGSTQFDVGVLADAVAGVDGFFAVVGKHSDQIIGFCVGYIDSLSTAVTPSYSTIASEVDLQPQSDIGYLATVCIDSENSPHDLPPRLVSSLVTAFEEYAVSIVVEVGEYESDLRDIYSDMGFESIFLSQDYWHPHDLSVECEYCGRSSCECSGELYMKQNEIHLGDLC
jgi:ribosomal protein S18 acetylase RimI-like enzyme